VLTHKTIHRNVIVTIKQIIIWPRFTICYWKYVKPDRTTSHVSCI